MTGSGTIVCGEPVAGPPLCLCALATPDGDVLVAGTVDGRIVLHSPDFEVVPTVWRASDDRVVAIATTEHDGDDAIVSLSESGEFVMWRTDGGRIASRQLPGITARLTAAAALSRDSSWPLVAWTEGRVVYVFDGDASTVLPLPGERRGITAVGVGDTATGPAVLVGRSRDAVIVAPLSGGDPFVFTMQRPDKPLRALALRFDVGRMRLVTGEESGRIVLWDVDGTAEAFADGHGDWVRSIIWTTRQGGEVLATASDDGSIRIWEQSTNVLSIERHTASVRALTTTVTPEGQPLVVSGGTDGSLRFWDVATGRVVRHQRAEHGGWIEALTTLRDGNIASAGNGTVGFWTQGGDAWLPDQRIDGRLRSIAEVDGTAAPSIAVAVQGGQIWTSAADGSFGLNWTVPEQLLALASDGTAIAAGGSRTLLQWQHLEQPDPVQLEVGAWTRAVQFVPDRVEPTSRRLAAVGNDGVIRLWDRVVQSPPRTFPVGGQPQWALIHLATPDADLLACCGDDRSVHVVDVDTGDIHDLTGHTGRGRALTTVTRDGALHLASAGTDGTIRLWDVVSHSLIDRWPRDEKPADLRPPAIPLSIDFADIGDDDVARADLLGRAVLAAGIAAQVRQWAQDEDRSRSTKVMPVLIDAPWGAGKSTLVNYLGKELRGDNPAVSDRVGDTSPWLVPLEPFDAWRESQVGAAWWSLLNSIRGAIASQHTRWWQRRWFGIRGFLHRVHHAHRGTMLLFGIAIMTLAFIGLAATDHWPFDDGEPSLSTSTDTPSTTELVISQSSTPDDGFDAVLDDLAGVADSATKLLTFGGFLLVGWFALVRVGLWYTPLGARLQQRTTENPMGAVISHVHWLRQQAHRPIAIVIDDLDRCRSDYVVAVLEALQTVVRQPQADRAARRFSNTKPRRTTQPMVFIVAADSAWLRSAIEQHYDKFAADVGRPGRSLGWLFLDKLFPIRVRIIDADADALERFTRDAFDIRNAEIAPTTTSRADDQSPPGGDSDESTEADDSGSGDTTMPVEIDLADAERRIADAPSLRAKEAIAVQAPLEMRDHLRVIAARTSVTTEVLTDATRELAPYVSEIASIRNPRTIKQFRNGYVLNWIAAGGEPDNRTILRWTLLDVQWADVAERLRVDPDLLDAIASESISPEDPLRLVLSHPDVRRAAHGLEPARLRRMLRLPPDSGSLDESKAVGTSTAEKSDGTEPGPAVVSPTATQ